MKVTNDMILREVAGEHILIPVGAAAKKLVGLASLNGSGLLLWQKLQKDCTREELIAALLEEYEVSREQAEADVDAFLAKLTDAGMLENVE